jgi:hypothetical protein
MSIETVLTVQNPSQFDFFVTYVNQKFYLDSKLVGDANGYWVQLHGGSLILKASSSLDMILDAENIPIDKEQVVNLYAIISIGINTPLPEAVTLRFVETLQDNM